MPRSGSFAHKHRKTQSSATIQHLRKKICFQNIPAEYKVNINQSVIEDLAKTINTPPVNKTWDEMDFNERKSLVEEFLEVDPTDYEAANTCGWIAYNPSSPL